MFGLLTTTTLAQEMQHNHQHQDECPKCCCEKKFHKCTGLCHLIPTDQFVVSEPPQSIRDLEDNWARLWLNELQRTTEVGEQNLNTWMNVACIKLCEIKSRNEIDFQHITAIAISEYSYSQPLQTTPITNPREISTILRCFQKHHRFGKNVAFAIPDILLTFADASGTTATAIRIPYATVTFDLNGKYYYRLTRRAQRILKNHIQPEK